MRTLEELIVVDEPGIALLRDWAGQPGANQNVILAPDAASRGAALERLQVTTRSLLGAVVYETGGLLVDDGRLRIFGTGHARTLVGVNEAAGALAAGRSPPVLHVADDYIGGLFAIDGGGFKGSEPGSVFHLPADGMSWISLEIGYGDFISWCLRGDLRAFYEDFIANDYFGAQSVPDMTKVNSFYPFLWTLEGRNGRAVTRIIDADEGLRLRLEFSGYEVSR